jgi:hypothetical protein
MRKITVIELYALVESMSYENEVVIVKYFLPNTKREKLIIFPKGTDIYVPGHRD